jgi:DNA repair photolyase
MPRKLTLQGAMERFLKTRPEYKPTLRDIDICIRYAANNFAYITMSTESTTSKLRRQIEAQAERIEKLTLEINRLHIFPPK